MIGIRQSTGALFPSPTLSLALALALAVAPSAAARGNPPRIWTWSAPEGRAATHPAFIELVSVYIPGTSGGASAADQACNQIAARGLAHGEVAIILLQYGRETLAGNPLDQALLPAACAALGGRSPWTANGRAQMRGWTDDFVARYETRRAELGIPTPDRFHMDCELRLPTLCYLPNIDPCWGTAPVALFDCVRSDARWTTEPLLLSPGGLPNAQTLAASYADAGSISYDATLPRTHPVNQSWSAWWDGLSREIMEGALDEAFFAPTRAAWPQSLGSEFASSMRLDGGIEPDGSRRDYHDFEWWNNGWMRARWDGRAPLQAPAIYLFGETFLEPGEGVWEGNMRLHRANLDACLHSYGGAPAQSVTPWVSMPGIALPFGLDGSQRAIAPDEFLELAALLRGRGIDEWMAWFGGPPQRWNQTVRAVDAAWKCELASVSLVGGTSPSSDLLADLRRADRRVATVSRAKGDPEIECVFDIGTAADSPQSGRFFVAIEGTASGASWSLRARRTSDGAWVELATTDAAPTLPGARWLGPFSDAAFLDGLDRLTLRFAATGAAGADAAAIDLVQVVRPSPCAGDVDGDFAVNANDVAVLLGAWGAIGANSADLDGNGVVNAADLGALLAAWGGCR